MVVFVSPQGEKKEEEASSFPPEWTRLELSRFCLSLDFDCITVDRSVFAFLCDDLGVAAAIEPRLWGVDMTNVVL